MPSGKYYIGDLCYALSADWVEIHDLTIKGRGINAVVLDGEFNLHDGRRFALFNTTYGDGCYSDQFGRSYGVDAGSIGAVLLKDARLGAEFEIAGTEVYSRPHNVLCAHIIDFPEPFECRSISGVIQLGHITIPTADDEADVEEAA
jgi:hypothetical protein